MADPQANFDPRIDAYIDTAAPFAQPILHHLRSLVHQHCPQVQETIKWGFPHYQHKGTLCGTAAFKAHCTLYFRLGRLLDIGDVSDAAMGQFGRLTKCADLPADEALGSLIKAAVALNETGAKDPVRSKPRVAPARVVPPDWLQAALQQKPKALATFEAFSPSHRKEYVVWLTEAKTAATRQRRLAQALEWMAEGKPRNWKYAKC